MLRTTTPYRPAPKRPPAFRPSAVVVFAEANGYHWCRRGNAMDARGPGYRTPALAMLAARASHDFKTQTMLNAAK